MATRRATPIALVVLAFVLGGLAGWLVRDPGRAGPWGPRGMARPPASDLGPRPADLGPPPSRPGGRPAPPAPALRGCSGTSTGLVPLTDLGTGSYEGFQGGLYPDGANERPGAHEAAGVRLAAGIRPRDPSGRVDPVGGIIALASIGMSNTSEEFQELVELGGEDPAVNPRVVLVNGARGFAAAGAWADPDNEVWDTFAERLAGAGVAGPQLQAVWIKSTAPASIMGRAFPDNAMRVEGWLEATVRNLIDKYPSVRIAYLSSRVYGGYATNRLNPEPFAYVSGFSVKWLVEEQIEGSADLAYHGPHREAPWLSWGPYLWADGLGPDGEPGGVPGRSDGLEWACTDFGDDGTHPSASGEEKVARILLDWLKADPTAAPWFLARPT